MTLISLPGTDFRVFPICLGTGDIGFGKLPEADVPALLDHYVDRGGNFLDTARIYSDWIPGEIGRSERILGDYLAARPGLRDRLIISSKGAHPPLSAMHQPRVTQADIAYDIEQSLRALRTDRIDLWHLHRDDPKIPVADILNWLNDHLARGNIRAIACSNWKPARVREAMETATRLGLAPFRANQLRWSVGSHHARPPKDQTVHTFDEPTRQLHADYPGLTLLAYSAQANGFFDRMTAGAPDPKLESNAYHTPGNLRVLRTLQEIAHERRTSLTAIVLSYLLSQPLATIPIIGTHSPARLDAALTAIEHPLTPEQLMRLEREMD